MKKIFVLFCFTTCFVLTALAQGYKITEPYGTSEKSGKLSSKSTQKYTYLYDTSLIQAIKLKDEERVKLLMYAQVNPNEKNDEGFTPLYFAAQYLTPDTLTLLLDRGARVNLTSKYNLTPLMAAAAAGRADNVEVLLEYGADPNMLDDKELTALDHAFNNHQLEAAIILNPVTTVKKPTMNEENLTEDNINGNAVLEHEAEPQQTQEPEFLSEETISLEIIPDQETYNPTLAEIDAKIEQTRQALARLIALRKQIVETEEAQIAQAQAQQQAISAKTTKPAKTAKPAKSSSAVKTTTYTKTTTTKTTSVKKGNTAKFGASK